MSWLDEIARKYKYTCKSCGETHINESSQSYPAYEEPRSCTCGGVAAYSGFLPTKLRLRGKVSFEQNGRKAYQITDGNGGVRYTSATKEHFLETGDIKPQYTKAYSEHLVKVGQSEQLEETKFDKLVADRKHTVERLKTVKVARESMLKEDSSEI